MGDCGRFAKSQKLAGSLASEITASSVMLIDEVGGRDRCTWRTAEQRIWPSPQWSSLWRWAPRTAW